MQRKRVPRSEEELSDRERRILDAVVRIYVDTAEPAGSRTVARRFELGVSPATVRNTMSDLEEKGYLFHPHTSAGRVPTDRAYRYFVDELIRPRALSAREQSRLVSALEGEVSSSAVERLVSRATQALSVLSLELGVAVAPSLEDAVLDGLELIQVSSEKILLVASIRSGFVRTVYVDLAGEFPADALSNVARVLNERLVGLTLAQIRLTLPERLRDSTGNDPAVSELMNIFMQAGAELFGGPGVEPRQVHLGRTSVLATQPEFTTGEQLKGLIQLTERSDLLGIALGKREHGGGIRITIGAENEVTELSDFTLVTSEYQVGGLKGVIGVIGPTRMPYEKIITIVDYTSSLVTAILGDGTD